MAFGGWLTVIIASALAMAGVFMISGIFTWQRVLSDPIKVRSNHAAWASRGGGIAIAASVGVVWLFLLMAFPEAPLPPLMILVVTFAVGIGLIDDIASLPTLAKLFCLGVLAGLAAIVAGPVSSVPVPGFGAVGLPPSIGLVLSTFIVLGFANMVNFMDGLNGMAGTACVLGLGILVFLVLPEGGHELLILWVVSAAAVYGFLVRNVLRGTIFLGDAGSLGLGFLLAGSALEIDGGHRGPLWVFLVAFTPMIADVAYTILKRWRQGRSLLKAHNRHLYQKLRAYGWSHEAVSLVYALMVLVSAAMAFSFAPMPNGIGLAIATILSLALMIGVQTVMVRTKLRVIEEARAAAAAAVDASGDPDDALDVERDGAARA